MFRFESPRLALGSAWDADPWSTFDLFAGRCPESIGIRRTDRVRAGDGPELGTGPQEAVEDALRKAS
jgi:hypothetical protein